MSKWRYIDPWDPDDPAIRRMNEALSLPPTQERGRPEETPPVDAVTRRERVASLVQRIEAGDLAAVATLRALLLDR